MEKFISHLVELQFIYFKSRSSEFTGDESFPRIDLDLELKFLEGRFGLHFYDSYLFNLTEAIGRIPSFFKYINEKSVQKINNKQYLEMKYDYDLFLILYGHYKDVFEGQEITKKNQRPEERVAEYLKKVFDKGFSKRTYSLVKQQVIEVQESKSIIRTRRIVNQLYIKRNLHIAILALDELNSEKIN